MVAIELVLCHKYCFYGFAGACCATAFSCVTPHTGRCRHLCCVHVFAVLILSKGLSDYHTYFLVRRSRLGHCAVYQGATNSRFGGVQARASGGCGPAAAATEVATGWRGLRLPARGMPQPSAPGGGSPHPQRSITAEAGPPHFQRILSSGLESRGPSTPWRNGKLERFRNFNSQVPVQ